MALPVLFPIISLGSIILTGIKSILIFLIVKRIAIAVGTVAGFVIIWVTFYNAVNAAIGPFLSSFNSIPTILQIAFKTLPSNTDECIAAVLTIETAKFLFHVSMRGLDYLRNV